jgi:hypothetical protein
LIEIKLADIFRNVTVHGERQMKLLGHFFLDETIDLMFEKFLPADSILGVGSEH